MKKWITLVILAAAIATTGFYSWQAIAYNPSGSVVTSAGQHKQLSKYEVGPPSSQELLEMVNAERAKVGVQPLTIDARIENSAQRKADDMVKYNYFSHVSPHDGQHGYTYVAQAMGDDCRSVSENIVWPQDNNTTQGAMYSWMHSVPHRVVMLDKRFTLTGFGISGNKVVEHFCQV